ncbi:MAG: HPr-rel-A system PqqD family peptide chaperone [Dechloromonas sp.]|nr:HPr-rel-A system PqqD family peptide chaperone [Dechloromonas sp.]
MLTASALEKARYLIATLAGRGLRWDEWDDVFIVYQPSSAETHVFNETTALILKCLEHGPLSAEEVKVQTEASLGVGPGELADDDFAFATSRLEELGLIDCLDAASAVQ